MKAHQVPCFHFTELLEKVNNFKASRPKDKKPDDNSTALLTRTKKCFPHNCGCHNCGDISRNHCSNCCKIPTCTEARKALSRKYFEEITKKRQSPRTTNKTLEEKGKQETNKTIENYTPSLSSYSKKPPLNSAAFPTQIPLSHANKRGITNVKWESNPQGGTYTASGTILPKKGNMKITISKELPTLEVDIVEGLAQPLVSVGQICDRNQEITILFDSNQAKIVKGHVNASQTTTLATAPRKDRIYILDPNIHTALSSTPKKPPESSPTHHEFNRDHADMALDREELDEENIKSLDKWIQTQKEEVAKERQQAPKR